MCGCYRVFGVQMYTYLVYVSKFIFIFFSKKITLTYKVL